MSRTPRRAAAWAAPVLLASTSPHKRRYRMRPMLCVLWLPERGGYLKTLGTAGEDFTVSRSPEDALQLDEDQAEAAGQSFSDAAGVRVHLRPFVSVH